MPDVPLIDAHVHLTDPARLRYPWMRAVPALDRPVRPADVDAAAAPVRIAGMVFVEVDVDPPLRLGEAEFVAELAAGEARLRGMVASLPLEQGEGVRGDLDRLMAHRPLLVGIRRLLQDETDPEFLLRPGFLDGLRLVADAGLAFDICVRHHQLPAVARMVERVPEGRFVLDHLGKPDIRGGKLDPWRSDIDRLAALPDVHAKLSGLLTEAGPDWTEAQVRPFIDHAVAAFGFDRLMFGGDWHVLSLVARYPDWVGVVERAVAGATEAERRKLFGDTARAFYRLPPPSAQGGRPAP